ncbi:MAG: CehA/McbA family metallohydrolase [Stagnimonas sp.]|nr:CehA/McbA family metallohydrolase [Stagnimonas sp.]
MKASLLPILLLSLLSACGDSSTPPTGGGLPSAPACAPGAAPLEFTGSAGGGDAKSYRMLPFAVAPGTGRVELSYDWSDKPGNPPSTPLTSTTFDLGLWDQRGYRSAAGFRGWGGSRQGRSDNEQAPIFVQADGADRGFVPGRIEPGLWFADLGIAAVAPNGADYRVRVECKAAAAGAPPAEDPVDRGHVARFGAGWYHGDFHMHAYHSNPNAPDWPDFIAQARAAQLDFLMVTEYVTGQHWHTLGAVQRQHPDLLIWPGREIITYHGHMMAFGETPSVLEYRHGFEDVSAAEIQRLSKADGALFGVNHPTTFPPPLFSNFCRGCYFELDDAVDWSQVDTIELVNGPMIATADDLGIPLPAGSIENPFVATAIQKWEGLLAQGYKITAVSGSDSKGVDAEDQRSRKGYGSSATAVHAQNLSRPALSAAIRAGHAYIRARGIANSPQVLFEASGPGGQQGIYGDSLVLAEGETATLTTTVSGGVGQLLSYYANGLPVLSLPVPTDPYVHTQAAARLPVSEGPLGTFWRIELRDAQTRTVIGNPIFLKPASAGS